MMFSFDPNRGETPESIRRQRELADALMASLGTPNSYGSGIQALMTGIATGLMRSKANRAEAAGRESARGSWGNVAAAFGGRDAFPPAPGSSSTSGSSSYGSTAAEDLAPHQRALLNTISGPESGGDYNVIYGGSEFSDFSDHPRKAVRITSGPNAGKTSSAAGKYQFLGSTWDQYRDKLGLKDFSPGNQDRAAWALASDSYRDATGRDLDEALLSGDPSTIAGVGKALRHVWTSLPGGIEQGTNTNKFLNSYQAALNSSGRDRVQGIRDTRYDPTMQDVLKGTGPVRPPQMPFEETQKYLRMGGNNQELGSVGTDPVGGVPPSVKQVALALTEKGLRTPDGQRFLSTMLNPKMMGEGGGGFADATSSEQQVAQALTARGSSHSPVQVAQAGDGPLPEMAGNQTVGFDEMGGPDMQTLMEAAGNPWLSEDERRYVESMIDQQMRRQQSEYQRQQEMADPRYQLGLEQDRLSIEKTRRELELMNGQDGEFKVVGNRLVRIGRDGTVTDATPQDEGSQGQFRFQGNSVEAQALNGLMDSGQLTPDQAQQLAAGKTISGPNGEILFLTPKGVFGQQGNGGQPQPVGPQPSRLMSPELMGGQSTQQGQQSEQRPGVIPVTNPKPTKPTEKQRNDEARVNSAFSAINTELDRYAELVGETGIEAMPGKAKDQLNTVRQGVMLQMKELFNLGVLNGPDLSLMERMIYDPTVDVSKEGGIANLPDQAWTAVTGNAGNRAQSSVAELKRMLTNIRGSVVGGDEPASQGGWTDVGGGVRIRRKD